MRFRIEKDSVSIEKLDLELKAAFPQYQVRLRGKRQLQVFESPKAGASVVVGRSSILVVGNFPTGWGRFLFGFCVLIFGFILSYGVYGLFFRSKMKRIEKQVARFVKARYVEGKSAAEASAAVA